jgi:hypothetical protein
MDIVGAFAGAASMEDTGSLPHKIVKWLGERFELLHGNVRARANDDGVYSAAAVCSGTLPWPIISRIPMAMMPSAASSHRSPA